LRRLSLFVFAVIVLTLVGSGVSAASEFNLVPIVSDKVSCASETVLYIFEVHNTGTSTESYTTHLSGSASKWAAAAPLGFQLSPGKTQSVYVYVTPSIFALAGKYNLDVSVSSSSSQKQLSFSLDVSDCHIADLTANNDVAQVCSATQATYDLVLENNGRYKENFELSLSGNGARYSTLSNELVSLNPGESKVIQVFALPVGNAVGDYTITATAKSQNSRATASETLLLKSNACYDYNVALEKNFVSICENSEVAIPLTIKNTGTADNTYDVILAGPNWAHAGNSVLRVPANSLGQTEIILAPDFGVKGTYDIDVRVKDGLGNSIDSQKVSAKVNACYSFDLNLERSQDSLCPFNTKSYELSLANTGRFSEEYAIQVTGADFATVDRSFVTLDSGESSKLNLIIDPAGARAGKYRIDVKASAQGISQSSKTEVLNLDIADLSACFGVQATSALTTVEVVAGEGALVPIIIENKGTETSSYNLEVSGSGATYAQLNPASVTLDGRKSQTIYMYISVPDQTPQESYKVTVSARLQDGTISSSTNVNVIVKPSNGIVQASPGATPREKINSAVSGVVNRIKNFKNSITASITSLAAGVQNKLPQLQQPATQPEQSASEIVEQPQQETPENSLPSPEIVEQTETTTESNSGPEIVETPEQQQEQTTYQGSILPMPEFPKLNLPEVSLPKISVPNSPSLDKFIDSIKSFWNFGLAKAMVVYNEGLSFAKQETYNVSNALWISAIFFVLLAILMLFNTGKKDSGEAPSPSASSAGAPPATSSGKGVLQRFVDFLEEEDEEVKQESQDVSLEKEEPSEGPNLIQEQNLADAVQKWSTPNAKETFKQEESNLEELDKKTNKKRTTKKRAKKKA